MDLIAKDMPVLILITPPKEWGKMIEKEAKIFNIRNYFPGGQKDFPYLIFPVPHDRLVRHR